MKAQQSQLEQCEAWNHLSVFQSQLFLLSSNTNARASNHIAFSLI